jgi:hypothetical protein
MRSPISFARRATAYDTRQTGAHLLASGYLEIVLDLVVKLTLVRRFLDQSSS